MDCTIATAGRNRMRVRRQIRSSWSDSERKKRRFLARHRQLALLRLLGESGRLPTAPQRI